MTKVVVKLNCTLIEDSTVPDGSTRMVPAESGEQPAEDEPDGVQATMKTVHLCAVTSDDPEDATGYALGDVGPAGKCSLFMTHEAAGFFEVGEDVYVQFSGERPE
jgi:hypothetical protein